MRICCEKCGLDMDVPPDTAGRKLKCPGCRVEFICPRPAAVEADERAPADEPVVLAEELDGPAEKLADLTKAANEPSPPTSAKAMAGEALANMGRGQPRKPVVRESPRQWQVIVGGVAAVALSYKQLVEKAARGEIKPKTKIHYAPKALTLSAGEIPGLFPDIDAEREKAARAKPPPKVSRAVSAEAGVLADALGSLESAQAELPQQADGESVNPPADESAEMDALAQALRSDDAGQSKPHEGGAKAGESPNGEHDQTQSLADALGEIERDQSK